MVLEWLFAVVDVWLFEIPLAYWLAIPLRMRSNGVFFSIAIAESAMAVTSAILFKRGKWKKQRFSFDFWSAV